MSPANPLTARVTANWVWAKFFGRGLVTTLDDFGTQGREAEPPGTARLAGERASRPGWSLKKFHTLIVTSATYRQSSAVRPDAPKRDPLNVLLARQSRLRLEAETDPRRALAASGLLNRTVGGPSIRPPQPPGISELTYANSAKWVETTGPERYKRGLYIWFQRTSPYPMLITFDAPDSNVCAVRRERSNTPLQALTLLNDAVFVEAAQALGKRVLVESKDATDAERITRTFRLCLGRAPLPAESERLAKLFGHFRTLTAADPDGAAKLLGAHKPAGVPAPEAAAWVALARTLMNLDEFVTRE